MAALAIIGTGYVGLVTGACLSDFGNTVVCVDVDEAKIGRLKSGEIPIYEPGLDEVVVRNTKAGRLTFSSDVGHAIASNEVVFIAVGTPPLEDGSADLRYVESAARKIGQSMTGYRVIVDKSTVPIGTGREVAKWISEELASRGLKTEFDVVSNPEFLREGTAVYDFTHPDRVVIGTESQRAFDEMRMIYRSLYINETPFIHTNLETAEMIKYASNAFLAVKITFINEVANLCEAVGANVMDVAKGMGRDGRIGPKFLHPGPGYGGSCFPKDTKAIADIGRKNDCQMTIIDAVIAANERQKKRMVAKIERGMGDVDGKQIAVLGLSFKGNTDDMRDAPALTIVRALVAKGAKIKAFDPAAMESSKQLLRDLEHSITYCANEFAAIEGADALVILTEWNQFRNLDLVEIKRLLKSSLLFDMRNIFDRETAIGLGFTYVGVGR